VLCGGGETQSLRPPARRVRDRDSARASLFLAGAGQRKVGSTKTASPAEVGRRRGEDSDSGKRAGMLGLHVQLRRQRVIKATRAGRSLAGGSM